MKKTIIEDVISLALEDMSFEDILQEFDITPVEVFVMLYNAGKIDEEILEGFSGTYAFS
jgi:hypothetical protein